MCCSNFIFRVNGDDAYDFITGNASMLDQQHQLQDNSSAALSGGSAMKSDLTSILNSKLQQDTSMDATRGLHFLGNDDYNAKRNLTVMLESKQMNQVAQSTDNNSAINLFDDNFTSGGYSNASGQGMSLFSSYAPDGDVALASASLFGDSNKYGCMQSSGSSQCNPAGATPPGSRTQTADLTQELNLVANTMHQPMQQQQQQQQVTNIFQSNPTSGGSVIAAMLNSSGSSLVGTPSSLDTLSAQDSREKPWGSLSSRFTDTVADISGDLSANQSMDMSEPLDFTFSGVDTVMPQMVP